MNLRCVPHTTRWQPFHSEKSSWYVTVLLCSLMAESSLFLDQNTDSFYRLDVFSSSHAEYQRFVHRTDEFIYMWQVRNLSIRCLPRRQWSRSASGGRWIVQHSSTTLCSFSARSEKVSDLTWQSGLLIRRDNQIVYCSLEAAKGESRAGACLGVAIRTELMWVCVQKGLKITCWSYA